MSEWIKREDRKPPKGVVVIHTNGLDFWTVKDIGHDEWMQWAPLPAPPPRTIMVEINEDAAKHMSAGLGHGPDAWKTEVLVHIGEACAKALEAIR